MRRPVAVLTTLGLAVGFVVAPVVSLPVAQAVPVTPSVWSVPVSGVDGVALRSTPAPEQLDATPPADSTVSGGNVASPRTDRGAERTTLLRPAVVTAATTAPTFGLIAVTFPGSLGAAAVGVRVRENGTWGPWQDLAIADDHGPDPGSVEDLRTQGRRGTEPLLTDHADGFQLRIDTATGRLPTGTSVTFVDPKASAADANVVAATPLATAVAAGMRPAIISRAQWGADESLRSPGPGLAATIKVGFVHHTASSSGYSPEQGPAQVRALYAWYTQGLNYSDMAYNFLVDRYGRVYEGRAGGVDKPVIGGHTAGFNIDSFAISAIGNYDTYDPPSSEVGPLTTAIGRLLGWKLALYHRNPAGSTSLVSSGKYGTSPYPKGSVVAMRTITGHGEVDQTACPGRYLKKYLPRIRQIAAAYAGPLLADPSVSSSGATYPSPGVRLTVTPTVSASWRLSVRSVCRDAPIRVLTGTASASRPVTIVWDGLDDAGRPVLPGRYDLDVSANLAGSAGQVPGWSTTYEVRATAVSPPGPCDSVSRLVAPTSAALAVLAARTGTPTARNVAVLVPSTSPRSALVAAPLAAARGAVLLEVGPTGPTAQTAAELRARQVTTAYLVGPASALPSTVDTALRALGVTTITRLTSPSPGSAVATAMEPLMAPGPRTAVLLDASAPASSAVAAASFAALSRSPVFLTSGSAGPDSATRQRLTALAVTRSVVVADSAAVPDAAVAGLPGFTRINPGDPEGAALMLPTAFPSVSTSAIGVIPAAARVNVGVLALRRPILVEGGPTLDDRVRTWITATPAIDSVTVFGTSLPDSLLGAVARAVALQPVGPLPVPDVTVAPTIPTSFSFSGAGFGHGVGLSQYGARGQALAGRTATQIVKHYFRSTTVDAVPDAMTLRVNILHAASSLSFRSRALAAGGGAVEVKVGSATVTGTPADVFTVTRSGSSVAVVRRTGTGSVRQVGTGASLSVRWEGTTTAGSLGTVPTVLQVVPGTTAPNSDSVGKLLRDGTLDAAVVGTGIEVVTALRLHDEYLNGIAEVSTSWPAAALQAQVLAARSYALAKYGTGAVRAACRCHVDDGFGPYSDQTFLGWRHESSPGASSWLDAVAATSGSRTTGLAIRYGGKPITAFYFSSSGGVTQPSQDVWGGTLPWAVSVPDPWSLDPSVPLSSWKPIVRTQAQVAAAFGLLDVVSISLDDRFASGAVRTAIARSSAGVNASLRGTRLRTLLGLRSTWIWRVTRSVPDRPTPAGVAAASAATAVTGNPSVAVLVAGSSSSSASRSLGAALAGSKGWPLLVTDTGPIPSVTLKALSTRKITQVYIVAGPSEIPDASLTLLRGRGLSVTRVGGASSGEPTALSIAVARLLAPASGTPALIASVTDPWSMAIAAAASARSGRPLLLVKRYGAPAKVVAYVATELEASEVLGIGSDAMLRDVALSVFPAPARAGSTGVAARSALVADSLGPVTRGAEVTVALAARAGVASAAVAAARGKVLLLLANPSDQPAIGRFLQRSPDVDTIVGVAVPQDVLTALRRV